MKQPLDYSGNRFDQRYFSILAVLLAIVILLITWFSIRQSRSDSFNLLRNQGVALTEALAQAAQNAISSEIYYDQLIRDRLSDLILSIQQQNWGESEDLDEQWLVTFAQTHDLLGIYIYDSDAQLELGVVSHSPRMKIPEIVAQEVALLLNDPESNYTLLLNDGESSGEVVHYYLELTNRLDRVYVLAVDALYYSESLRRTGIGILAQNMASTDGVEYIIYQSTDGIIFASEPMNSILAIESDDFLNDALVSDNIQSRLTEYDGKPILELVRPFSSRKFPFGLFRVALSLDKYYAVSRGFDQQLIILSGLLLIMTLVFIAYLGGRRKRYELSRRYTQIKSMTDHVFDQMKTGVVVIDKERKIRLANATFSRQFLITNPKGKLWDKIISGQARLLDDFIASGSVSDESEIEIDNGERVCQLLVARSKLEDGALEVDGVSSGRDSGVVMVTYDITQLREFEKAVARKERLSEMGDLAAGVAHEIRNPLNSISIAAQRLAIEFTPKENNDEFHSFTRQIRNETKRLNDIITRFLALAREENKKRELIDLSKHLEEVCEQLAIEGDNVGLKVTLDVEDNLKVIGIEDKLRQVFLNLFKNSKEVLNGDAGSFLIQASRKEEKVHIAVSDSGAGIPSDVTDKLFAPYFTTKDSGTGLGLPTVQRIITDMGGEIRLDTKFKEGARFLIILNVASPS